MYRENFGRGKGQIFKYMYQWRAVHGSCGASLKSENVKSIFIPCHIWISFSFISLNFNLKFMELFNVRLWIEFSRFHIIIIFAIFWKILWFYEVESKLVRMYLTSDFHLKTINWIKKLIVNDERKYALAEVFDCT